MTTRQTMENCPPDDTLRLIWFEKRSVPCVCLYVPTYVSQQGHHGWWSVSPHSGGMQPEWGEPREWQEIANETVVVAEKVPCPICVEPEMAVTRERGGEPNGYYIECTNVKCASNIPSTPLALGRNWIDCPCCEADDIRAETTDQGTLIHCVNMSCPPNTIKEHEPSV